MFRFACLLLMLMQCYATTIRETWYFGDKSPETIRVVIPDSEVMPARPGKRTKMSMTVIDFLESISASWPPYLNFTFVYRDDIQLGMRDAYGNYTGFIGFLQRGEADYAYFMARPDSFVDEPIQIGPVLTNGDVVIVTAFEKDSNASVSVLKAMNTVDGLVYSTYVTCAWIASAILAFMHVASSRKSTLRVRYYISRLSETVFHLWGLSLNQENFTQDWNASQTLWLHVNVAVYVGVVGIFLNCMSTDLVAKRRIPHINSLDDLLSEEFAHIPPLVITNLFVYPLLKYSAKGSKLHDLYLHAVKTNRIYNASTNSTGMYSFINRTQYMVEHNNECCLAPEFLYHSWIKRFVCHHPVFSKNIENARLAKESFGGGTITWLMRNGLSRKLRRALDIKLRAQHEMGLAVKKTDETTQNGLDDMGFSTDMRSIKCMEQIQPEAETPEPFIWLKALNSTFRYFFLGLELSIYVVLFERVCLRRLKRSLWKRRRRRRVIKPSDDK